LQLNGRRGPLLGGAFVSKPFVDRYPNLVYLHLSITSSRTDFTTSSRLVEGQKVLLQHLEKGRLFRLPAGIGVPCCRFCACRCRRLQTSRLPANAPLPHRSVCPLDLDLRQVPRASEGRGHQIESRSNLGSGRRPWRHTGAAGRISGSRLEAPATVGWTASMKDLVWRRIGDRRVRPDFVSSLIPDPGSFRVARRPESGRLSSSRNLIGCHKVPSDRAPTSSVHKVPSDRAPEAVAARGARRMTIKMCLPDTVPGTTARRLLLGIPAELASWGHQIGGCLGRPRPTAQCALAFRRNQLRR